MNTSLYTDPYFVYSGNEEWLQTNPLFGSMHFILPNVSDFDEYMRKTYNFVLPKTVCY